MRSGQMLKRRPFKKRKKHLTPSPPTVSHFCFILRYSLLADGYFLEPILTNFALRCVPKKNAIFGLSFLFLLLLMTQINLEISCFLRTLRSLCRRMCRWLGDQAPPFWSSRSSRRRSERHRQRVSTIRDKLL